MLDKTWHYPLQHAVLRQIALTAFDPNRMTLNGYSYGILSSPPHLCAAVGRLTSRRGAGGVLSGTASDERDLMCADLEDVLQGGLPREYGDPPPPPPPQQQQQGDYYKRLAPSTLYDRLLKLRKRLG